MRDCSLFQLTVEYDEIELNLISEMKINFHLFRHPILYNLTESACYLVDIIDLEKNYD